MRRLAAHLLMLLVCCAGAAAPAAAAISESGVPPMGEPTIYSLGDGIHAGSMIAGPENAVWFTGVRVKPFHEREAIVGRILPDGQVREFPLPPGRSAGKIAVGADGSLWFGESYLNEIGYVVARIGRMSTAGEFSEFKLGNHVGGIHAITAGPDRAVWFTTTYWVRGRKHAAIARINRAGAVARFPVPPESLPQGIVAGPDRNLWFAQAGAGAPAIGRISTRGKITRYPLRDRRRSPSAIVLGPDGNLWFSEQPAGTWPVGARNRIGRITTEGTITQFAVPGSGGTGSITAAPKGQISFIAAIGGARGAIGSLSPGGELTGFGCLAGRCNLVASTLAAGPEGSLWFTAHKYYPHSGGGGSGIMETMEEEAEAGLVGHFGS